MAFSYTPRPRQLIDSFLKEQLIWREGLLPCSNHARHAPQIKMNLKRSLHFDKKRVLYIKGKRENGHDDNRNNVLMSIMMHVTGGVTHFYFSLPPSSSLGWLVVLKSYFLSL